MSRRNEIAMLIAMPVAILRDPVAGSVVRWCATCGCAVWLSPDALALEGERPTAIICMPCAVERMAFDPNTTHEWQMMPGANPRIQRQMMQAVTNAVLRLRRKGN